jgi:hypothetical protein
MARSRNIKPGFFSNDELVELPFEFRLLFIGLWTIADREGRLVDRPKKIRMEIFPSDVVDCDTGLKELETRGFISRYGVDDVAVIEITNFARHQAPHSTEKDSSLPDREGLFKVNQRTKNGGVTGKYCLITKEERESNVIPTFEDVIPPTNNTLIPDSGFLIPDSGYPQEHTTSDEVVVPDYAGNLPKAPSIKPDCPHQQIIALYHEILPMCPQVRDWTPARAQQLRARWNEDESRQTLDYWRRFFEYVKTCGFLIGNQPNPQRRPFFADLEWLTKSANFTKIRERKYE